MSDEDNKVLTEKSDNDDVPAIEERTNLKILTIGSSHLES